MPKNDERDCSTCRFLQPYDGSLSTAMCSATIPRHAIGLARLPTGDCKPEGLLYEARK